MTLDFALFLIMAIVAVASAISMLFSRNAVYSALFLSINFCTIASKELQVNLVPSYVSQRNVVWVD